MRPLQPSRLCTAHGSHATCPTGGGSGRGAGRGLRTNESPAVQHRCEGRGGSRARLSDVDAAVGEESEDLGVRPGYPLGLLRTPRGR